MHVSKKKLAIGSAIAAVTVIGGSLAADAAVTGSSTSPTGQYTICAKNSNNVPVRVYSKNAGCSTGYHTVKWTEGKQGAKGDPGKDAIESISSLPDSSLNTPVTLHNVGGSIRAGVTDLGSVTLDSGTYDAKVLATFYRKVNTSSDPAWASKQTYATLVIWTGDSINADFSNDTTLGGVLIPKVNSATLTIDPGANLDATIKVAADGTPVHVGVFAYNDDSSSTGTAGQPGAGTFSAVLQSATFEQLNVG